MAQRKTSTFAGQSAVAPAAANTQSAEPSGAPQELGAPMAAPEVIGVPAKPAQQATASTKPKKKKVSFYQLPVEEDRARAAWMHTMGHTGHTTITSFMEAAVSEYTRKLEEQYNDSTPFN